MSTRARRSLLHPKVQLRRDSKGHFQLEAVENPTTRQDSIDRSHQILSTAPTHSRNNSGASRSPSLRSTSTGHHPTRSIFPPPPTDLTLSVHEPTSDDEAEPLTSVTDFSEAELYFPTSSWRWSLVFPEPRLEMFFQDNYFPRFVYASRLAIVIAIVVNIAAAFFDNRFIRTPMEPFFPMDQVESSVLHIRLARFLGLLPLGIVLLALTWTDLFRQHRQTLLGVGAFATGALMVCVSWLGQDPDHGMYLLFLYAVFLLLPITYSMACWVSLPTIVFFNVVHYHVRVVENPMGDPNPLSHWLLSFAYVISTAIVLALASYYLEFSFRHLFLQRQTLKFEQARSDLVLNNIVPEIIGNDLKLGILPARHHDATSILFADIAHFKELTHTYTADQVIELLNSVFLVFDDMLEFYDVFKVETIGEEYMVVAGAPEQNDHHAQSLAALALEMLDHGVCTPLGTPLEIRIGLHTGNTIAGVVGHKLPRYRFFGDTVNTASRMKSTGEIGKIQVSSAMHQLLQDEFSFNRRGEVSVQGKGMMETFWLSHSKRPGKYRHDHPQPRAQITLAEVLHGPAAPPSLRKAPSAPTRAPSLAPAAPNTPSKEPSLLRTLPVAPPRMLDFTSWRSLNTPDLKPQALSAAPFGAIRRATSTGGIPSQSKRPSFSRTPSVLDLASAEPVPFDETAIVFRRPLSPRDGLEIDVGNSTGTFQTAPPTPQRSATARGSLFFSQPPTPELLPPRKLYGSAAAAAGLFERAGAGAKGAFSQPPSPTRLRSIVKRASLFWDQDDELRQSSAGILIGQSRLGTPPSNTRRASKSRSKLSRLSLPRSGPRSLTSSLKSSRRASASVAVKTRREMDDEPPLLTQRVDFSALEGGKELDD